VDAKITDFDVTNRKNQIDERRKSQEKSGFSIQKILSFNDSAKVVF